MVHMTLDDRLQAANYSYESQLEQKLNKKSGWFKVALDTILYTPVLAASALTFGPAVTLSTAIPAVGYTIGAWWENRKKKIKMTWNRIKREVYTGNIMGHADYGLFSVPEFLFKAYPATFNAGNLISKLLTTLIINPLVFIPVNAAYGAFFYLRDKIGFKNTFRGIFNGKAKNYLKQTYNDVKKNLYSDTKNVFKYMFPLHFFQMNYLPGIAKNIPYVREMPVAAARMTQSALINNPIYRIVMSTQKKSQSEPKYNMNYSPGYT